jgi:hypothetical protein
MPDFEKAITSFGQLIGLLNADGSIVFEWFGSPEQKTLDSMRAHHEFLGALIRALLSDQYPAGTTDQDFSDGFQWDPLNIADKVGIGPVWNKGTNDLALALGARVTIPVSGKQEAFALLIRMLDIQHAGAKSDFGKIDLIFPAPDFLSALSLEADLTVPKVSATVANNAPSSRTISSDKPAAVLPWDCARIALFILESWIHKQAQGAGGADNFFTRTDKHLFPMFGEPAGAIQAFPLFGESNMGTPPNFDPWRQSVLTTSGDAAGALAFLWHLRALLTGNESPSFIGGSFYLPLVGGAAGGHPPSKASDVIAGATYPPSPDAAGAWVAIVDPSGTVRLEIELRDGKGKSCSIPLAEYKSGTFSRPAPDIASISTFLASATLSAIAPDSHISAKGSGTNWTITVFNPAPPSKTGIGGFDGPYQVDLVINGSAPIVVQVSLSPTLQLTLPPDLSPPTVTQLMVSTVQAILSLVSSDPTLSGIATAAGTLLEAAIKKTAPDIVPLLKAIGKIMGNEAQISAGPVTLAFDFTNLAIKPGFSLGPINESLGDLAISIGKLDASLGFGLKSSQVIQEVSIGFTDLRIGATKDGAFTGLIGTLIPDMKKAPGFLLTFDWTPKGISLTGGGKIPVQMSFGPLAISAFSIDIRKTSLSIGIDLSFQLSAITVVPYELGLQFNFDGSGIKPFLHGLGVSFDGGGITLAGMFAHTDSGDYVGGAVVGVEDMFQLSAIGGYRQLNDGAASMFIFASLVAPLGGPPYFFITGIAGGFGYSRMLPDFQLMDQHPFIKVMNGELPISGSTANALDTLSKQFLAKEGDYWIAAGIQFLSFGFINGKLLVAVAFGHDFSFNLLGIASFGIDPIAYFEIDLLVTIDQEKALVIAGVSPNSYLISKDIFSLHGQFGLGVWHSGDHAADFVLSIGGYHPSFTKPEWYPALDRVGVTATVYGFVHVNIDCFFACTPQALMAGAQVSLWASFAGISAGLDVYVDVFIKWDPFFIQADLGVTVWFEFMGRHEIGVDLEVHTPPFGGTATIHLFIVSFDVSFGTQLDSMPTAKLFEFVRDRLNVPAKAAGNGDGASLAIFSTDTAAGLVSVFFLQGATPDEDQAKSNKQLGVNSPVHVSSEFVFSVRTHLPLPVGAPVGPMMTSADINLPLCGLSGLATTLKIQAPRIDDAGTSALTRHFPASNFGDAFQDVQAQDSKSAVAEISGKDARIELMDGVRFAYKAKAHPETPPAMTGPNVESSGDEGKDYPLPLSAPATITGPVVVGPKSGFTFSGSVAKMQIAPRSMPRPTAGRLQEIALPQPVQAAPRALSVNTAVADLKHEIRTAPASTIVAAPPAGTPVIAPPPSPGRRAELFPISLRVVPAHAATAAATTGTVVAPGVAGGIKAVVLPGVQPAANIIRNVLTPAAGVITAFKGAVSVASGQALHVNLAGGLARGGSLALAGSQTVRAIFLTAFGEPVGDVRTSGNATVPLPRRARRVVLMGEGNSPAVLNSNIGIEKDTVLLALDPRSFAAHGCVLHSNTRVDFLVHALDSFTGTQVLRSVTNFRIQFPPAAKGSTLVLSAEPVVPNPAAAPGQVRWRANATLGSLNTVIGPDRVAFVMSVESPQNWALDVDLGTDWRIAGAVVSQQAVADMAEYLRTHGDWDLVDDRLSLPAAPVTTTINMEIANG